MKSDSEILKEAERAFDISQIKKARALLAPLIERDVAAAILLDCAYSGADVPEEEADRRYIEGVQRAAELGDAQARYRLGVFYDYGEFEEYGVTQDKVRASEIFRTLAEEGDPHCMYIYGCELLWGLGSFETDVDLGMQMLRAAIDGGSPAACMVLAKVYNDGECGYSQDLVKRDRLRSHAKELAGEDG